MEINVIITGATGMVGEGVLIECLAHPDVKQVLIVNRRHYDLQHPKLKECIVPDFMFLDEFTEQLTGYDACFYCAGTTSLGLNEKAYSYITYDTTLHFAQKLLSTNPNMIFNYVSGNLTDSSEKGKLMWARVKGRTENALMKLPFKRVYNFRPGIMKPTPGQKSIKTSYKIMFTLFPLLQLFFSKHILSLHEVGLAMINSVRKGYDKEILEIKDIRNLANS